VVSRLAGFTERETLRTWTVLLGAISIVGIALTLAASRLAPLAPPAVVQPTPPAREPKKRDGTPAGTETTGFASTDPALAIRISCSEE